MGDIIEISNESTDLTQKSAHSGIYVPIFNENYMDRRIELSVKNEFENIIYCVLFTDTNAQA